VDEVKLSLIASTSTDYVAKTARGRRLPATVIELGPVRVTDHSKTAGRAEAARQLQAWLGDYHCPDVVRFKDNMAVLVHEPGVRESEITVRIVSSGVNASTGAFYVHASSTGSFPDWRTARQYALKLLVMDSVDFHDDASVTEGAAVLSEGQANELWCYAGWQRAYRHAENSLSDVDPHRWAGDNCRSFMPSTSTMKGTEQ
jgi:hypothetical protein